MHPREQIEIEELPDVITDSIPNNLPVAKWQGELQIGLACYVLNDGRRLISRKSAVDYIASLKGGGNLEAYDATAGNDFCNGRIAPTSPADPWPNLKECLHLEDVLKAVPVEVPDSSKAE